MIQGLFSLPADCIVIKMTLPLESLLSLKPVKERMLKSSCETQHLTPESLN